MPIDLLATADGLAVTFSVPLDRERATDPGNWSYRAWQLDRTERYGSPHVNEHPLKILAVDLSSDGRTATVRIEGLEPTPCYELAWSVAAAHATPIRGRINGTLHACGSTSQ
jgi:hypothetical protein